VPTLACANKVCTEWTRVRPVLGWATVTLALAGGMEGLPRPQLEPGPSCQDVELKVDVSRLAPGS
jgi:hypothetical protein